MFVHDNGKIAVLANSRCGHQSMYEYFGIPVEVELRDKIDQWAASPNRKVLVLRNPIERMWSGLNLYNMYALPIINLYDVSKAKGIEKNMDPFPFASLFVNEDTRHDRVQDIIFRGHCAPYLDKIEAATENFEIIDFARLGEYIPLAHRTNITNCDNITLENFVDNDIFTREDMEAELIRYERLKLKQKELQPFEWVELTS